MAVHFFVVACLSLNPNIENILRKREIFKSKLQMFGRLLTYSCKVTWSITFHFNTPFKCQISIFIWIDWTGIASIACGISKALHCSFGKTFEISYIKYFFIQLLLLFDVYLQTYSKEISLCCTLFATAGFRKMFIKQDVQLQWTPGI